MAFFKKIRNLRIRTKLILSYSICFALVFTGGSTLIYHQVAGIMGANLESELETATAMILKLVKTSADLSVKNRLKAVAEKNLEIVDHLFQKQRQGVMDTGMAKKRAREILLSQTIGKTGYIYVIDSNGMCLVHPREGIVGRDHTGFGFIREMIQKRSGYMVYQWQNPSETRNYPKTMYFVYFEPWDWIIAVTSYRSEFMDLLDIEDLREAIASVNPGKRGYSTIMDMAGNLILHPRLAGNLFDPSDGNKARIAREVARRKTGRIDYQWQNPGEDRPHRRIATFKFIPEYEWVVVSTVYAEDVLRPLATIRSTIILITLAVLSVLMGVSILLAGGMARSLEALTQRMERYTWGRFKGVAHRNADEIQRLSANLDLFMDHLSREMESRRRVERSLRINEKRHRTILESAPNPIILYDTAGNVVFVNNAFTRVFGWELSEVAGKKIDFIPPERFAETERAVRITRRCQTCHTFETKRFTKDGRTLDVSISAAVYRDKADTLLGTVVNFTDITHIRATHRELRLARNYIKEIIDSMPSVLVGVDVDGRVTLWNQAAETFTTISRDRAKGRLLSSLLPRFKSLMGGIEHAVTTHGIEVRSKVRILDKDEPGYFDIIIYPLGSGGIQGAVVLITDVSQRVFMEEMMIQSEKMLSVGGLAAGMAHEINNPLAGIMQNLQVLVRRLREPLPVNVKTAAECGVSLDAIGRYMEKRDIFSIAESAVTAGARAARIVENMLSFSRKGNDVVESHPMDELMDATLEIAENDYGLKKQYDFRSITIKREYAPDLPPVPCERSKIQQVFFNIIKNGAQAMVMAARPGDPGPCFTIRILKERDHARIEIEDNGPGMAAEAAKRIFDPFYTTKGVREGTGLGLSVSYFIIRENHGGTIEVDSAEGKGTCFIIRLPLEARFLSLVG